ncbi:MAG: stage II sporulation protein M [Micrococcales bacterium]|nr:stage II sporulation protein M [Micrococcales bacterium]
MDLDAFVAAHQREWSRLEELVAKRRLTGAEADEILDSYQRVATHLSVVRSTNPDPSLVGYLSMLLARARSRSAGTRSVSWGDVGRFFAVTYPAALYRLRWWWLATLLVNVVLAFALGWYFLQHPSWETSMAAPEQIRQLVENDFEGYYSEYAATSFALRVWTNNFWIALLCIALGVLGLPVVFILLQNVLNVAIMGAIMWRHGRGALFFGLILPHGLLELTSVFVAAGVGMRLFWAWVEPGPRTRAQALAEEGRTTIAVGAGLVVTLLLCGVIEAFVTPSPLPTFARVGIGVLAELAFFAYVFTLGRWAVQRGETGDLAEAERGYSAPVAG